MKKTTASVDFSRPYPVFPLEDTVLFPNTLLPLHIFETRYRKMLADVLDSFGLLVLANFREKPDLDSYLWGTPALRPDAALGQVIDYERLDDGCYHIVLYGLCRLRIVREVKHSPYRTCKVMPFDTLPGDEVALSSYRDRITALINRLMASHGQGSHVRFDSKVPTKAIIDQLIDAVCSSPKMRLALLGQADVNRRAAWLIRYLSKTIETS